MTEEMTLTTTHADARHRPVGRRAHQTARRVGYTTSGVLVIFVLLLKRGRSSHLMRVVPWAGTATGSKRAFGHTSQAQLSAGGSNRGQCQ